jgi:hypothetical protein
MVIPEFNCVNNVYAWVDTVEDDLTSIGRYSITSSTWVRHDPCTDVPQYTTIIVAPPASSTVEAMATHLLCDNLCV